jgi:hypothetical protein
MWLIEDQLHGELQEGEFLTRHDAIAELTRRAELPYSEEPNRAPCVSWRTCERHYVLIERAEPCPPWTTLSRERALDKSAEGLRWHISG